ncbi:MAG: M16 family metallopeptidase [Lepagella sp.]
MDHSLITLPNGIRVVSARSDGNVAYIGVLTRAGSRDDFDGCDGLSHFVEHTIFKGTPSRRSWQVSARMESVGGELNAYTTKDEIMLYTNAPAGYEDRALDLIADLVMNASFPKAEIDLERGVILEEILSYRDNPSFAVFDEFDELFFQGSPLAHNILGYEETVNNITSERARQFLCSAFAPRNMVLYCVSPSDPQRLLRRVEKFFGAIDRTPSLAPRVSPLPVNPFDRTKHLDNHQANTVIGFPIFGRRDPRCYSLYLLNNILGGPAMNSLLNREMRERRGLVYTVETSASLYDDTGVFQIYFGTEPKKVEHCTSIALRELRRLAEHRLSERKFGDARRQICGQLLVGGDNRESCAMSMAKNVMRQGRVIDTAEMADLIMQQTAEQVRQLAEEILANPYSRLTLA